MKLIKEIKLYFVHMFLNGLKDTKGISLLYLLRAMKRKRTGYHQLLHIQK
jgi:hypothetical protein